MLNILLVTFPFFALVLAGFVAAHWRWLPLDAIPGLNGFVLFFALPCMLYRFGAGTPILQLLDVTLFCAYLLCALLMVGFVVAVSLSRRIGWNDAAFGALVGAFPNTGFMGVPLLVALLGSAAAGPAIVTILVDLIITTSLCIALSRLDGADEHGASKAARNALKGVLTNPMPWAILMGAASSGLGFTLLEPIEKTVALLADSASPVALFTIGAVLARSQIRANETHHAPILWRDVLPTVFFKLVLHPVLVLLVFSMGSNSVKPNPEDAAPIKIAQGIGLVNTPFKALRAALLAPCSSAPSSRDKAMHKDVVMIKSTKMVTIAGPAAAAPKSATKSGTPIKPVLGNAPTNAPNAASFQPIRRLKLTATTKPTISKAHNR